MRSAKFFTYALLLVGLIGVSIGFLLLSKHILRSGPEEVKWIIAVVLTVACVLLNYFGKPLRTEKGWSRNRRALRSLAVIVVFSFVGSKLVSAPDKDMAYWMTFISIFNIYAWFFIQANNKFKKEKEHINNAHEFLRGNDILPSETFVI